MAPPALTRSEPASGQRRRPSVLVCRGCCCGTNEKHPTVDHDAHLARLQLAAARKGTLWTVDCLGLCERSNVVVVRSGNTRYWFGEMLGDTSLEALATWIAEGAGVEIPDELLSHRFVPGDAGANQPAGKLFDDVELFQWMTSAAARGGTWLIGVPGACVLFDATTATVSVDREVHTVTLMTSAGSLRLHAALDASSFAISRIDRPTEQFAVVVAVPAGNTATPLNSPIVGDVDGTDGGRFDLALDAVGVRLSVRSADPFVAERIDELDGRTWHDAVTSVANLLATRFVHGAIETSVARMETRLAADGMPNMPIVVSPGQLDLGKMLPDGMTLPNGFIPAAIYFPPAS